MKKKRSWIFLCVLLTLFSFSGCGETKSSSEDENGTIIFCLDQNEQSVVSRSVKLSATTKENKLTELLLYLREPGEEGMPAIKDSVRLPMVVAGNNGLVTLQFDESYTTVSGVREVLMRAAIVKTLCQMDFVDSVEFYVAGQPLMGLQNQPIGIMKEEDFIDNTGEDVNYLQYVYATVYYANKTGDKLVASNLKIPFSGSETEEQVILNRLFEGPTEETVRAVASNKVKVNSVSTKDGVCTVDLNARFLEGNEGCSEEVTVYSVVNTLIELPNIMSVQILIDGELSKQVLSIDISKPLERNLSLIEAE